MFSARTIVPGLVCVGFSVVILDALITGTVLGRGGPVSRAENPVLYFVLVGIYVALAAVAFYGVMWS